MPFTEEEKRAGTNKSAHEFRAEPVWKPEPVAVCIHCQSAFGINEDVITGESPFVISAPATDTGGKRPVRFG